MLLRDNLVAFSRENVQPGGRRILVSVSEPSLSFQTLAWVMCNLVRLEDIILLAHSSHMLPEPLSLPQEIGKKCWFSPENESFQNENKLETLSRICERLHVAFEAHSLVGEEGPALLELAERGGAGIIVVAVSTKNISERALYGSVSEYLIHHANIPVVAVMSGTTNISKAISSINAAIAVTTFTSRFPPLPIPVLRNSEDSFSKPSDHLNNVVAIAVDESAASNAAFGFAVEQLCRSNDCVVLIHVTPPSPGACTVTPTSAVLDNFSEKCNRLGILWFTVRQEMAYGQSVREAICESLISIKKMFWCQGTLLYSSSPPNCLILIIGASLSAAALRCIFASKPLASKNELDTICFGEHASSAGLSEEADGSIAEAMLRRAECDVVIAVKPQS